MKNNNKKPVLFILLLLVFLAFILQSSYAANITITDTSPGGIRQAIAQDSLGTGDTLFLSPGTYNVTGNDTNIAINKNITIQGIGPKENVIIDARGVSRIFSIANNVNVKFVNITFANGTSGTSGLSGWGGAIFNNNPASSVTITNCIFKNNFAGLRGGAIFNVGNNLNLTDCRFINNYAEDYGGAVYNEGGSLKVTSSNFTNNSADGSGGAIYNSGNNLVVIGSNFNDNGVNYFGGAIFNSGNNLIVLNSKFTLNEAGNGGAIYNDKAVSKDVTGSIFSSNHATYRGGAIYNSGNYLNVKNSNFTNNNAEHGGAIFTEQSDNVDITGCNFINNVAILNGGAIYNSGKHVKIMYNRFVNNTGVGAYIIVNQGTDVDANYNWWGSNKRPLLSGITVRYWFVMMLSIDNPYETMVNAQINRSAGTYVLSYQLVLYNSTSQSFVKVSNGNLPNFLATITWTNQGNVVNVATNVNAKGTHFYQLPLTSNGVISIQSRGDNENVILTVGGESYLGNVNLVLTKKANTTKVTKGQKVTYTITVTNTGVYDAYHVVVTESMPSSLVLVSSKHSQGSYNPTTGKWDLGNLNSGQTATLTITVLVNGTGSITNKVSISTDNNNLGNEFANFTIKAKISDDDNNLTDDDDNSTNGGNMKKTGIPIIVLLLVFASIFSLVVCRKQE